MMDGMEPTVQVMKMKHHAKHNAAGQRAEGVNITYVTPNGDEKTEWLSDGEWNPQNKHLCVLAALGHKPSDYDGDTLDLSNEDTRAEATFEDGEWVLASTVLQRGEAALHAADWFSWEGDNGDAVTVNIGGNR